MRKELEELENVLQSIIKLKDYLVRHGFGNEDAVRELLNGVESVNIEIFGCIEYPGIPLQKYKNDWNSFVREFEHWKNILFQELKYRKSFGNKTDYTFAVLSSHILARSEEALIEKAVACLRRLRQESEQNYQCIVGSYRAFDYFWGALDLDKGIIDLLKSRIHEMKSHWADFCWLYNNLADYRSKKVLYGILHYWLTFDFVSSVC